MEKKIQVMVATSTLAWGINMPAHLVIIKGTEYYDGKTHKYIDFPVTGMTSYIEHILNHVRNKLFLLLKVIS